MRTVFLASLALLFNVAGAQNTTPMTARDSLSYALGITTGYSYKENLAQFPGGAQAVDQMTLVKAFGAALSGDNEACVMSKAQAIAYLQKYFAQNELRERKNKEEAYKTSQPANNAYIEQQKKEYGFTELNNAPHGAAHGTLVKTLKKGTGEAIGINDIVCINYVGQLPNGHTFDHSNNGTALFPVDATIKGLADALLTMRDGEKASLIIPSELGYGREEMANGAIPANSVLKYDIEIVKVLHSDSEVHSYLKAMGGGEDTEE